MANTGVQRKRPEKVAVNDTILFGPSVQMVAGTGYQRYLPLITAYDITTSENPVRSGKEVYHE